MAMKTAKIENVKKGDVIAEGSKFLPVKEIEVFPVMCAGHVHVNGNACYDIGTLVKVL